MKKILMGMCCVWGGCVALAQARDFVAEMARSAQEVSGPQAFRAVYAGLDLHAHTYCSDGEESPEGVVRRAKAEGVEVLAVTDHDTMACVSRAQEEARLQGVRIVKGIELSAGPGSIHVIGLGVSSQDSGLRRVMEEAGRERIRRARAMVEKLNALKAGPAIDFAGELVLGRVNKERAVDGLAPLTAEEAGSLGEEKLLSQLRGEITRPDIARVLVAKGYVSSSKEAFDKFIGNEGPAYEPMRSPHFEEMISLVHQAGGIAVLAHPFTVFEPKGELAQSYPDFESLLQAMAEAGLDGLEFYRPPSKYLEKDQQRTLQALGTLSSAQREKLLLLPASDYHGKEVGSSQMGGLEIPLAEASRILDRIP